MTSPDARSAPAGRDPRADYTRHLEARRAALAVAIRQHVTFGNLRAAALAAILAVAYLAFARGLFSGVVAPRADRRICLDWRPARARREHAHADRARRRVLRAIAGPAGRTLGRNGR